jgi:hypothetical protein
MPATSALNFRRAGILPFRKKQIANPLFVGSNPTSLLCNSLKAGQLGWPSLLGMCYSGYNMALQIGGSPVLFVRNSLKVATF